jgi:hypothetical protein
MQQWMALIGFGSRCFLILLLANAVFLKLNSLANARPIDSAYSITNLASPPSIGVTWTGQDAAGEWLGSEFVAEPTSLARQPITWNNGRVRNGSGASISQNVIIDNSGNRTQVPAAMPNATMTPIAINNSDGGQVWQYWDTVGERYRTSRWGVSIGRLP